MKEVNTNYYQQLLDKGRLNSSDRDFYQKVLNSVKKQGGKATERQYNILQQMKFGKTSYSPKNEHIYNKKLNIMNTTNLRQLIRESIQEYIREIDEAGNRAALEAKIAKTQEAIDERKRLTAMEGLDEAYQEYLDERKMKEMTSEIKILEKSIFRYKKSLEKMNNKNTPKMEEMQDEEVMDEVTIDPPSGAQLEEEDSLNEEQVLYMQKMAGIISEREYNEKLEEAKKKPSAGLTKKQKSAISKKAHKGEDIGKKGKGFEKVAKAGEKQYGSKEAGEKVAAAAMWKNIKRK